MRKTVNISLPESIRFFMVRRAREKGCASVSEYIRDLIRNDQEQCRAKINEQMDRHHRDAELRRRGY